MGAGPRLGQAPIVAIMVHGRNAGPENILDLTRRLDRADVTYLAPAAANRTWYPHSFMAPRASNEPFLSSALSVLRALVEEVEAAGVPRRRIVLVGFSQGACLATEFAIRHASRFGGVVAFSGGAIGEAGTTWAADGARAADATDGARAADDANATDGARAADDANATDGARAADDASAADGTRAADDADATDGRPFGGTPIFFGCSDVDAHVPESRVRESADVCARMGADVTTRIYPGMGHLINDDEISFAQRLLDTIRA